MQYTRFQPGFRLSEIALESDGPTFIDFFVENKDVFGLTVRATYGNVFGGRSRFSRTVFDGPRTDGDVLFFEDRNLRVGPIFRFSIAGNF